MNQKAPCSQCDKPADFAVTAGNGKALGLCLACGKKLAKKLPSLGPIVRDFEAKRSRS